MLVTVWSSIVEEVTRLIDFFPIQQKQDWLVEQCLNTNFVTPKTTELLDYDNPFIWNDNKQR